MTYLRNTGTKKPPKTPENLFCVLTPEVAVRVRKLARDANVSLSMVVDRVIRIGLRMNVSPVDAVIERDRDDQRAE